MKFTFGIITSGANQTIDIIADSIQRQNIPDYEIIVVGGPRTPRANIHVEFDENVKPAWITRKKNIITQLAKFENIVYLHDYVVFEDDWYSGFLKFGDEFKVCMNRIVNPDGSRFRDWVICPWGLPHNNFINESTRDCLIPYDMVHVSKYQYISGTYWVAKKSVMQEFPLNEQLSWGESEDVLWSKQVREKYDFSMNALSTVRLLKFKDPVFSEAQLPLLQQLQNI